MVDTLELQYEPFPLLHMPVAKYDFDQDTKLLETLMIDTMRKNKGIGLAANQVNVPYQMFVMGNDFIDGFIKPTIFINPTILKVSEERTLDKEGCLSFPGLWLNVDRPSWIIAAYQDIDQKWNEIKVEGYMAKCFQHEFDHLHGICYTNRVGKTKLDLAIKKMRKGKR
jgi:peptide deformylase